MNILYLVPHVPRPTKIRSYQHIMGLNMDGHKVAVATVTRSHADQAAVASLRSQGFEILTQHIPLIQMGRNSLRALKAGKPLQSELVWSRSLMRSIEAFLVESPPDIIHVEHLRMTCYGMRLSSRWPTVWDSVDHLETLYRAAASNGPNLPWRLAGRLEARLLQTYEKGLVGQFPATLAITERDQELLQENNAFASRVEVAPIGWTLEELASTDRLPNLIVLTGALDYHPNIAAAGYFAKKVFPIICELHPSAKLQLIGSRPSPAIKKLASRSVEVTGFVPSVKDSLQRASVAVAPVIYGAGVQIKVLEAFLTGTPLVATSTALRGLQVLPGKHVLIGDSPEAFADAVVHLLNNPEEARSIGAAGRRYLEEHHNLTKTTRHLLAIYQRVISEFHPGAS